MKPAQTPLLARRNAPFAEAFTFYELGADFDFTGAVARMQVRLYGAAPFDALIDLETVTEAFTEGLRIVDGTITPFIAEDSLAALPRGLPGQPATFLYDLVVTLPGEVASVWREGPFIVKPGVTKRLPVLTDEDGDTLTDEDGNLLTAG